MHGPARYSRIDAKGLDLVMRVELSAFGQMSRLHWQELASAGILFCAVGLAWCRRQANKARSRRDQRVCAELGAYAVLVRSLQRGGCGAEVGEWVCRVVAEKSPFRRVAVMLLDGQGRLCVTDSVGMDRTAVEALCEWGGHAAIAAGWEIRGGDFGLPIGRAGLAVVLVRQRDDVGFGRAIVVPVRSRAGGVLGAVAVGADGMLSVSRRVLEEAMLPLESLVADLGHCLDDVAAERAAAGGLKKDKTVVEAELWPVCD